MEVLRHGSEVVVVEPAELRAEVENALRTAMARYSERG